MLFPFLIAVVILGLIIGSIALILSYRKVTGQLQTLEDKYRSVTDLEKHKDRIRTQIDQEAANLAKLISERDGLVQQSQRICGQLAVYQQDLDVIESGLYQPLFDFADSSSYKKKLESIRDQEKALVKDGSAVRCDSTWSINGSEAEGRKQTKDYSKLMLRAFNGEADAAMADVNWNNIQRIMARLESSLESINKMGKTHAMSITRPYADLKITELRVAFEYEEKLKAEKDEQRRIAEQMRDEEKARRDVERALKEAHDDEARSKRALDKAREELGRATGAEVAHLNEKIALLSAQLNDALKAKERAKSMAELTKSGHVYVISNIGSFGENTYKIGMTRRLDPLDRVHELGDASVPFSFDVHAMIYTENAPALEGILHDHFSARRVNMVNGRKEFFHVSLDEIGEVVRKHKADIEFIPVPEAREYRQTLVLRQNPQKIEAKQTTATATAHLHHAATAH